MTLPLWDQIAKTARQTIKSSKGKDPLAWANLSLAYLGQRKPGRAVWYVEKALALEPALAPALILKGLILGAAGDIPAAEKALADVLELGPQPGPWHFLLGEALLGVGDVAQAKIQYSRALEAGDVPRTLIYWSLAHLADQSAEKIHCLQQILNEDPSDAEAREQLISVSLYDGDLTTALRELQQMEAIGAFTEDGTWRLLRGDCEALSGHPDLALEHYRRAADLMAENPIPLMRMGEALSLVEQESEARTYFRRALQLFRREDHSQAYRSPLQSEQIDAILVSVREEGMEPLSMLWALMSFAMRAAWRGIRSRKLLPYLVIFAILASFVAEAIPEALRSWPEVASAAFFVVMGTFSFGVVLKQFDRDLWRITFFQRDYQRWAALIGLALIPIYGFLWWALLGNWGLLLLMVGLYLVTVGVGAFILTRSPITPDRHNLGRLLAYGMAFGVLVAGLFGLIVWLLMRHEGLSWTATTTTDRQGFAASLLAAGYINALFFMGAVIAWRTVRHDISRFFRGQKLGKVILLPIEGYRRYRDRFVEEWGFSNLYISGLPSLLLACILTWLGASFQPLRWCAYISWALNYFVLILLILLFIKYAFMKSSVRRIRLDSIARYFHVAADSSLQLIVAVLMTAALFAAFWLNYTLAFTNWSIVSPESFMITGTAVPVTTDQWFYIIFRLMISGNLDVTPTAFFAQLAIMLVSLSEFLFLGFFFVQIVEGLRTERSTPDRR